MNLIDLWYDILEFLFKKQIRSHSVKIGTEHVHFQPGGLIRIEADGSYCHLITTNKVYLISRNMSTIEKAIQGWGIIRVNRSNIINVAHIASVNSRKRQIIMSDGAVILIPRRSKKHLTNHLVSQYQVKVSQSQSAGYHS
ncbi:MAG: LytTR family DNA-binding domain-containing protein [Vicingaceae bacterium]